MRGLCVILHRYVGLATALFLVLLGLTGSVLAWREPLSACLAPDLYEAPARGTVLTPEQLVQRVNEAALPTTRTLVDWLYARRNTGVGIPVSSRGYCEQ
jgi:uncharacterized iron-regulated membrane protein